MLPTALLDAARTAFTSTGPSITLGAPLLGADVAPEPIVRIPLAMLNRHGLIAGATGTGKTKTLQLIAEQLSEAGVPVFLADIKGDLSGLGAPGALNERVQQRLTATGATTWSPTAYPVEFLSMTGKKGAQLRATVSSFGAPLLAKVLGLNDTQSSVLALVFKYCDDHDLLLIDFSDLRAILQHLTGDGADELKAYGGMSKQTVGVLLRRMVELESLGAGDFFGEPEFDLNDLFQIERDGRGLISVLELSDVPDKPAAWSTFMLWMLATLYNTLPEVGDVEKPKLVFFFDEAHLLFNGANKALVQQIETVIRLIRSKGIGVFFVTQSPKDIDADVLAQLGHRVQHALRAFTADDDKALRAAARTFPKTTHYDIEETLTSLGIGEAFVTVLGPRGVPTPPFSTMLLPPRSAMAPLSDDDFARRLLTPQVQKYATAVDRDSAREMLERRVAEAKEEAEAAAPAPAPRAPARERAAPRSESQRLASTIGTSMARTMAVAVAGTITRGILGALMGKKPRR
jgi:DNA helicase HerA-like ATPase